MTVETRTVTGRIVSPVLVGRDDQLHRLTTAIRHAPAVVVVEGEAGIGKTRLVTEMATHPGTAGRLVLTGACRRIREPFPLGAVVEALHDAGEHLTGRLSPVTGALRGLLPELADVLPPPLEPLDDRGAERHRIFRGLTEALRALGPAVLVLEDLHWADEQTVEFLTYLLAVPPSGLAVVLTYRGEETGADVREVTARVADSVHHEHIVLPLLDVGKTGELATAILGASDLTAEFAAHLHERSSGLPLAVQELLALLRERGSLIRLRGGWARRALAQLDVPPGVRDPVLERVGRLPAATRTAAEAAAVLAAPVPVPVLSQVAGLDRDDAVAGVDELLLSGLLVERDGTVAFRHLLAAQAVYGGIPLGRRQDLHARAVAAVRSLRPVPLGQEAHHLRQAGLLTEWVDAAERAADRAAELGDDAEAARILEDVLRTAPLAPDRRARLAVRLGWAAGQVLRPPDVLDLLSGALESEPPGLVRGQLHFLICLMAERLGDPDPAAQRGPALAAVDDLGAAPELAAWAMAMLGRAVDPAVPLAEHLAWLNRALEVAPTIDDPVAGIFVLGKVAMSLCGFGDRRWADLTDTIVARTSGRPRHRQEVHAYRSIAEASCVGGHVDVADRLLSAALRAAAEEDDPSQEPLHRCRLVALLPAWCAGRWDGLAREAAALLDEYRGRPADQVTPQNVAACHALASGDVDTARRDLPDIVRRTEALGLYDLLPLSATAWLRLATAHGDPGAALAGLADAVAVWEIKRLWPLAVRAVPALTEAMVLAGRRAEAAELVARAAAALDGLDAPLAAAALPHARGHLTAGHDDAAALLLTAATAYDGLTAPYEAAQAREHAAVRLFAVDGARAAAVLHAAIAGFRELGAQWDLDRAAQLARGRGLTVAGRHRGGPNGYGDKLSPREREVAELAAAGLTNQQIGRELFLSPRTVEKHLGAALRKLGLRSRAALGARLEPDP